MRSAVSLIALLMVAGCSLGRHRYQPMGEAKLDVEGLYATRVSELSNTCVRHPTLRAPEVEVYYKPGNAIFRMILDGLPFDVLMRNDGNFSSKPVELTTNGAVER